MTMAGMISEHVLSGCAPVPLAGYLKAIGIMRLLADQADRDIRGAWRDERFILHAALDNNQLLRFFIEHYRPTPVIAPWNSGSGFWPKDNSEGLEALLASDDPRLADYRAAILMCRDLVRHAGIAEAPKDQRKAAFVTALRGKLSDKACQWLDGALALTNDGLRYPPILGTGGNDGRLDFSNNFMQRIAALAGMDAARSTDLLRATLFATPCFGLEQGAVGQFSPGTAGGANSTTGFESDARVNPWDFVLTIEGALSFAAAATRRHAQDRFAALSFPFTTRMVGAGSGVTSLSDESDARHEFWAPLWSRPCGYGELQSLLSEGRAVLNGGPVRDGLDFARAVSQLGVSRGISGFARHAFLMRAGKAYFATPLGRTQVREQGNQAASLIAELDARNWLARARNIFHDRKAPASLTQLGRHLDEALFYLASAGSPDAVQQVLIALGRIARQTGRQPKLRAMLAPPPRLSAGWAAAARDSSGEFTLALALASLDAVASDGSSMPFRCHLVPIEVSGSRDQWADTTLAKAQAVWTGRDLTRDMAAILERRLLETQNRNFVDSLKNAELPLRGRCTTPLAGVMEFLAAGELDDDRIAALAAGLAWTKPSPATSGAAISSAPMPFAYAAIKPLFKPGGIGPNAGSMRLIDPRGLIRLLMAGHAMRAVAEAQRLARGAGLSAAFARSGPSGFHRPQRLAAALLFPITSHDSALLVDRAYPDLKKRQEATDVA
jgi:CRISPR-associated protein Csx17